ncbi:10720_t:CDS:2 [Ambispora leptoticha]|uniref:10720_t:CDS:1 n=1 Tax=Ambispora leptoticha TaxID=144679 RepID=A0A9N8VB91_9GLOM|nr:10720_t:CDS:2 [Ambispora leptoticha]
MVLLNDEGEPLSSTKRVRRVQRQPFIINACDTLSCVKLLPLFAHYLSSNPSTKSQNEGIMSCNGILGVSGVTIKFS